MRIHRLLEISVAATLVSPLAAFAAGTVTTAPLSQPAPALAMPALLLLAIALIGLGIYKVRTQAGRAVAGIALVAGLSLLAGLSHAIFEVIIADGACDVLTNHDYPTTGAVLISHCPNPIKVVSFVNQCDGAGSGDVTAETPIATCTIGEILNTNDECRLLGCYV